MRHHGALERPPQDVLKPPPGGGAIHEGGPECPRDFRLSRAHQVDLGDPGAPAGEPSRREVLNKVGDQERGAVAMEENHLGRNQIAPRVYLINLSIPVRRRLLTELDRDVEIPAAFAKSRGGIDTGRKGGRPCALPAGRQPLPMSFWRSVKRSQASSCRTSVGCQSTRALSVTSW